MASRTLPVLLALVASGSAAAVEPRSPPNPGFVSFTISREVRNMPFRTVRRGANVPLFNVSSASYLISCRISLRERGKQGSRRC